jgi:hypothetical protein
VRTRPHPGAGVGREGVEWGRAERSGGPRRDAQGLAQDDSLALGERDGCGPKGGELFCGTVGGRWRPVRRVGAGWIRARASTPVRCAPAWPGGAARRPVAVQVHRGRAVQVGGEGRAEGADREARRSGRGAGSAGAGGAKVGGEGAEGGGRAVLVVAVMGRGGWSRRPGPTAMRSAVGRLPSAPAPGNGPGRSSSRAARARSGRWHRSPARQGVEVGRRAGGRQGATRRRGTGSERRWRGAPGAEVRGRGSKVVNNSIPLPPP